MLIVCPSCATSYELPVVLLGAGRPVRCARCKSIWSASPIEFLSAVGDTADALEPAYSHTGAESAIGDRNRKEDLAVASAAAGAFEISAKSSQSDADQSGQALDVATLAVAKAVENAVEGESGLATFEGPPLVPHGEARAVFSAAEQDAPKGERTDIEAFAARRMRLARVARARRQAASLSLPLLILLLVGLCTALLSARERVVALVPQSASFYAAIGLPVNLRGLAFEDVRSSEEMHNDVPILIVEGAIVNIAGRSVDVPRLRFILRNKDGVEVYAWTAVAEASVLPAGETLSFRSQLASPPSDVQDIVVRFLKPNDLDARLGREVQTRGRVDGIVMQPQVAQRNRIRNWAM